MLDRHDGIVAGGLECAEQARPGLDVVPVTDSREVPRLLGGIDREAVVEDAVEKDAVRVERRVLPMRPPDHRS